MSNYKLTDIFIVCQLIQDMYWFKNNCFSWLYGDFGCQLYAAAGFFFGIGVIFSLGLIILDGYIVIFGNGI